MTKPMVVLIGVMFAVSGAAYADELAAVEVVPAAHVPEGYTLAWADEFDGAPGPPDPAKWTFQWLGKMHGIGRLNGDAASVDGKGHLKLRAWLDADGVRQTARVSSYKKFSQLHGYFVARIRHQKPEGMHSGFWLTSPTYGKVEDDLKASGAEVDIVEYFGECGWKGSIIHCLHWNAHGSEKKEKRALRWMKKYKKDFAPWEGFHEYAVEWNPEGYRFFVDGLQTWEVKEGVSERDLYVVFSLLCSEFEKDRLRPEATSGEMFVDWVRVYNKSKPVDSK